MEIDRDEMGSKKWEENWVKFVNTTSSPNSIKLDNIPEWLLTEVLIRLPVKLVFRFKLVSKQWLSVTSDPSFVSMYVSRASVFPQLQAWTFIFDGSQGWDFPNHQLLGDIYCWGITPPSMYVRGCTSAQHPDKKRYGILGVSNGFVLYGPCTLGDRFNSISICNPITGQWFTLPPLACPSKFFSIGFVTRVGNGVLTSYKVVPLNVLLRRSNVVRFEVFSSETGEWKDFNVYIDLEVEIRLVWPGRPTSLNGILHWITHKHGIIAYDPYHNPDCVRIIALPGDTHLASNSITSVGIHSFCDVHQGRLSYFKMADVFMQPHGFSSFSVWVLNDYSTGDWSLLHRINSADILYDGILSGQMLSLKPISFHPFDSDIFYFGYKNIIVSYNIKTRELDAHGGPLDVKDNHKNRPCWWSVFLLVIPPWPIHIPARFNSVNF